MGNDVALSAQSAMATIEIEQLVKRERYHRDMEQWSKWRLCYHPDSSQTFINISWFRGQIDEWVQRSRQVSGLGVSLLHNVNPVAIQIKDGRALAVSTCQIVSRFIYGGSEFDLVAHLRLVSCINQVEGKWMMKSLEGIYLQDSVQPVVPNPGVSVNFDMGHIHNPRSSYKCLIWSIERKGMHARRDLPGIDVPESVRQVSQRTQAWLEYGEKFPAV